jgi:hypothetical protein
LLAFVQRGVHVVSIQRCILAALRPTPITVQAADDVLRTLRSLSD